MTHFSGESSLLRNEPQYPTKGYAPHSGREGETATEGDRGGGGCCGEGDLGVGEGPGGGGVGGGGEVSPLDPTS